MSYLLHKLLRKGHVVEMTFHDPSKNNSYYINHGKVVLVIDNTLLPDDAEEGLLKDWNDDKLIGIHVLVSNLNTKKNIKVLAWDRNKAEFDWSSIDNSIRVSRMLLGFCDKRLAIHELKIQPLKILTATIYRNHYGIVMSHEISRFMDYETHQQVLGKLTWTC